MVPSAFLIWESMFLLVSIVLLVLINIPDIPDGLLTTSPFLSPLAITVGIMPDIL